MVAYLTFSLQCFAIMHDLYNHSAFHQFTEKEMSLIQLSVIITRKFITKRLHTIRHVSDIPINYAFNQQNKKKTELKESIIRSGVNCVEQFLHIFHYFASTHTHAHSHLNAIKSAYAIYTLNYGKSQHPEFCTNNTHNSIPNYIFSIIQRINMYL